MTTQTYVKPYLLSYPEGSRYQHGLPFEKKLAENLNLLQERVRIGKAVMIIIDGGVGEGKTTLAVQVADYLQGAWIELKMQLSLGGDEFTVKFRLCYQHKKLVIIYDEAGDFNKRGALTRFNAMMNRIFETFRAFKIIVIVVLPDFNKLDNSLFENKIPRLLLHLSNRTERQGHFRGFSLNGMLWLRHWMKKSAVKEAAYKYVQPNFYGWFLDLPPERSKALEEISIGGKLKVLDAYASKVQADGEGYSLQDLMTQSARSRTFLVNLIKKNKMQPVRVHGQKKFYGPEVLEVVMKDTVQGRMAQLKAATEQEFNVFKTQDDSNEVSE